jgi:thiol:disulfide interchange protein
MKQLSLSTLILLVALTLHAQDMKNFKLYNPAENVEKALSQKIKEAKAAGKHVFVQIGGNWCVWCARFHDFTTKDPSIDSLINANYVVYHMNWSKENENDKLMAQFGYPQRFGFPVFIILDAKGNRLHTQNSAYLEEGKGYSKNRVVEFFENWSPKALDPASYKKK